MNAQIPARLLVLGLLALLWAAGCAPADVRYGADTAAPADSSAWLWDGVIAVLAFVVGFLVAATMSRAGGVRLSSRRHRHRRRTEAGWDRVGQRIRAGTEQGLAEWRSAENIADPDWGRLSRRIEERIVEEMRKHHD
jgi:hypothetical protein